MHARRNRPTQWKRPVSSFLVLAFSLLCMTSALAAVPDGYYLGATGKSGATLRTSLHSLIAFHAPLPYDSASNMDVHDAIDILDEDPLDASRVRLLYSDTTASKSNWPAYNREHVWPQSLGADSSSPAHTDLHHIFACDAGVNSARSNRYFDDCSGGCSSHEDAPNAFYNAMAFEPPDAHKGDVARALFYMAIRYEGAGDEPDLRLDDLIPSNGCDCMSMRTTLMAWHDLDPVDEAEETRNDLVFAIQGNRNPFVDHPQWVAAVWNDDTTIANDDAPENPWFNEIHYDNQGADTAEGFEIAGPSGLSLGGWKVALYNGNNGDVYSMVDLSGIIPLEQEGRGALWFPAGMQNGDTDGLALIAPFGEVIDFISYEGGLLATGGPAAGMEARDISVEESNGTPVGHSIQMAGAGRTGQDFSWVNPAPSSPGSLNDAQHLWPEGGPVPVTVPLWPIAAQDGTVVEAIERIGQGGFVSATRTTLQVGDDQWNRAVRSVLAFDTSAIPAWATMVEAQLHLTRISMSRNGPFKTHGECLLEMATGPIGESWVLAPHDFQADEGLIPAGTVPAPNDPYQQVATDVNADALDEINRKGITQFRLRFVQEDDRDFRVDQVQFASGNHPIQGYRPVLIVTYY